MNGITVFKLAHMQLAGGDQSVWAMCLAVDKHGACATNPLSAIVIKSDRVYPLFHQLFIEHIHHFQKRHIWRNGI